MGVLTDLRQLFAPNALSVLIMTATAAVGTTTPSTPFA